MKSPLARRLYSPAQSSQRTSAPITYADAMASAPSSRLTRCPGTMVWCSSDEHKPLVMKLALVAATSGMLNAAVHDATPHHSANRRLETPAPQC
jgi:hypothetical protein